MTETLGARLLASSQEQADVEQPLDVSYSYWPVNYYLGDPTVIGNSPLPLSGVQFSVQARGVGEFRGALQVADPEVRAMNPWDLVVPRKTGIVVVRTVTDAQFGTKDHRAVWHGVVWQAPIDPQTGRMDIMAQTVESTWARRKITGPPPVGFKDPATGAIRPGLTWVGADQAQIVRDLLDPTKFSQMGLAASPWPGWITVDAPSANMGQPRDMTYTRNQETSLLQAHQDRSAIIGGYEWFTDIRVLSGTTAYDASTFRLQFIWGYPRLGRRYAATDLTGADIARFSYFVDGRGNVVEYSKVADGTAVSNVMWGTGAGYDSDALRVVSTNSGDWGYGFLLTEDSLSNPDVSNPSTLQDQTNAALIKTYSTENFVDKLTVRGDLYPHFGSYGIGDDCLVTTDDWSLPDRPEGRTVSYVTRIMGWTVTPPEGDNTEKVDLLISGADLVG